MASYNYDETGHMALFFIITVLFMVLVPFTLSQISFTPSTYKVSRMLLTLITVARYPRRRDTLSHLRVFCMHRKTYSNPQT